MKYSKLRILFFPSILIILIIGFIPNSIHQGGSISNDLNSSWIRGKIYIDGNWTETKAAGICTGDGTPTSPYVIENYEIDGEETGNCITVLNAYEYFTIENCTLYNATKDANFAGIYVENASNGLIYENHLYSSKYGIFLQDTSNINITFNKIVNERGLKYVSNCSDMWLYLNTFTSSIYGVYFYDLEVVSFSTPTQYLYTYKGQNHTNYLGNYWKGKLDEFRDDNNDGITDIPATYTGGTVNFTSYEVHHYALMEPHNNYVLIEPYFPPESKIPGYSLSITIGVIALITIFIIAKKKQN